jgi:hypothetical protein
VNAGTFKKGEKRPNQGRPKGRVNATTQHLKDAILIAAQQSGIDGCGKAGLVGYLMRLAQYEPKAFASLLARVLPLQVTGEDGGPVLGEIRLIGVKPE